MMAKTDAVTYAAERIRANAIVLGTTRTAMSEAAMSISPEGSAYLQNLIDLNPLKRQAEPDEVAKVVGFLAGPTPATAPLQQFQSTGDTPQSDLAAEQADAK